MIILNAIISRKYPYKCFFLSEKTISNIISPASSLYISNKKTKKDLLYNYFFLLLSKCPPLHFSLLLTSFKLTLQSHHFITGIGTREMLATHLLIHTF